MCTGTIECPVRPCTQSLDYNFYIDRLDMLTHIVYAHYSFQIQFAENGDYSVYIDGCCRPSIFKNKFDLPFHLRAGIQIYADGQMGGAPRPYPKQSISVSMPNVVMLRAQGYAYDGCKEFPCEKVGSETVCFLRFMVQTLHPIEEYRSKIGAFSFLPTVCPLCRGWCPGTACVFNCIFVVLLVIISCTSDVALSIIILFYMFIISINTCRGTNGQCRRSWMVAVWGWT